MFRAIHMLQFALCLAGVFALSGCTQVQHMSRDELIASFDGHDPAAIIWPSDGEGDLSASASLINALAIKKLPDGLDAKYKGDELQYESALIFYKRAKLRGLDSDLTRIYYASFLGKKELRMQYVHELADRCRSISRGERKEVNAAMQDYLFGRADAPGPFVCPKDSRYSEKPLP